MRDGGEPIEPTDPLGDCRDSPDAQLPNLKGGHSTRADFRETALVVKPLVRDKVGRNKFGLRRLFNVRMALYLWEMRPLLMKHRL